VTPPITTGKIPAVESTPAPSGRAEIATSAGEASLREEREIIITKQMVNKKLFFIIILLKE
jgi:hypothetical protein